MYMLLKKLERDRLHNLAIPPLSIYPRNSIFYCRTICSSIFSAVLFIKAMKWKEPKHSSVDHWMMKLWYVYTMKYY